MRVKCIWVLIAISLGVMKGEDDGFFPIIDYGTGHHESGSWNNEQKCIDSLGLTVIMGDRARPYGTGKTYDDTLLDTVCEPTGVKLLILVDPNVRTPYPWTTNFEDAANLLRWFHGVWPSSNPNPHNWDSTGYFPDYGNMTFHDRLDTLAYSLSMHMNSLTGKRIKDHDAFYGYLVCHENPEAYCVQCYEAIEELCERIKLRDPTHKTWAWVNLAREYLREVLTFGIEFLYLRKGGKG